MTGPKPTIPLPVPVSGTAPAITTQPASQSVTTGAQVTFTAAATGTPTPIYQWSRNGRFIPGANSGTYTIASASPSSAGVYTVEVYNGVGFATSNAALLSVAAAGLVSAAPQSQSIATGATAVFSVTAAGSGLSYQWQFDGAPISGATASSFTVANAGPGASGSYEVAISNQTGVIGAEVATLSVVTNARLTNLSARGSVGINNEVLIVGFVSGGTGDKQILLRGAGPALAPLGVTNALAEPSLTLYGPDARAIATDDGWGNASVLGSSTVKATIQPATSALFNQVYAFPFPTGSADCAMEATLPVGAFTAQVSALNASTGVALAEVYDADSGTPTASLINISARAYVANGGNVLVAGFVVAGPSSETILIRGVGPSLAQFGLRGILASTQVTLFDSSGNQVAANAGWGNDPWISATGTQVYAFPLMPNSLDSALLVTIPPGAYTAQVSGPAGKTGEGMVEIYEVR